MFSRNARRRIVFFFFLLFSVSTFVWYVNLTKSLHDARTFVVVRHAVQQSDVVLEKGLFVLSNESDPITKLSQSTNQAEREKFQRKRIHEFCAKYRRHRRKFTFPPEKEQRQELFRHLVYSDQRRVVFCFVEGNCHTNTKTKSLVFTDNNDLQHDVMTWELIDFDKYLQKQISFINSTLSNVSRRRKIKNYRKTMIVRNPLERLLSGYLHVIRPPFTDLNDNFPNYVKKEILEKYRSREYRHWLKSGMTYSLSITFSEFIEYLINKPHIDISPYFKPMIDICHPCRIKYDFYGNFKRYNEDLKFIPDRVITPKFVYHKNLHTKMYDSTILYNYYSQLSRTLKRKLFKKWRMELDFYYHLYPEERNSHKVFLDVNEST